MARTITKFLLLALLFVAGCGSDRYSKVWAEKNLKGKPTQTVVQGFLEFGFSENRGMVFGIMNNKFSSMAKNVLTGVRILILLAVVIYMAMNYCQPFLFHLPFVLIMAGALGNVIDSVQRGYVIDFIHIFAGKVLDWPFFFNLADVYLCLGMGIIILVGIGGKHPGTKPIKH